jgi:hypothetical protein
LCRWRVSEIERYDRHTSVADDHLISQNLGAKILIRHIVMTARTQQQAKTAAFGYPRER